MENGNKLTYDLIIIGAGPAGLTAGLYAARSRLNVLLVESKAPGGQLVNIDLLENYPGFPEGVSGMDLVQRLQDQAEKFGLEVAIEEVVSLRVDGEVKTIETSRRELKAKSVIVASGSVPRRLGVPGEDRFVGRGVSYCATCDGALYRDREVLVVGGGDSALTEALFLTRFARKVKIVHRRDKLRAVGVLQDRARANDRIEFRLESVVEEIRGEEQVKAVILRHVGTGKRTEENTDGIFIYIGANPATGFLPPEVQCEEDGYVVTGTNLETSVEGIFAAGDVRVTPLRQVATAVGDGAVAAMAAEEYLANLE